MNEKVPDEETRPTPPGAEVREGAKAAEEIEKLRLIIDSVDITTQWQAKKPWHKSEALLDIALEAGRMGVFEFDVRSGEVTWSPHLERIHGLRPGTFGGTFEDFKRDVYPGDLDRVLNQVQQTIQEKRTDYGVEYRIIKPSGAMAWVEGRGRVLYDANGAAERFVGLCMDVTTRKEAEEKLQSEFAFRRAIEDAIPAGIAVADPNGRQTYVNRAFCEMVGWSESELVGIMPPYLYWPPEEMEAIAGAFQKTIEGKAPSEGFELRFRRRNEERFDVLVTPVPLRDSRGILTGWLASVIDMTERKRVEEERARLLAREQQSRREAEAANRAKDEFLATISHELRTPLNAIYGWARLLQMGDLDAETVASAYETIERNAKAQAQLIDDLLDVSRIIAGRLRLDVRAIALGPVIEAAIETVQPAAEAKGISLQSRFDEKVGPISGDPDRLQQVIWNLLSNAIKFTPSGGRVEVRLDQIDFAVQIHVQDTGIGISPEFLPYVFDRFRQAEGTSTRIYGGLGLGLAIVRHLVELHGGTVSADSAGEGRGASFTVTLPLKLPTPASVDPEMRRPGKERTLSLTSERMLDGIEILLVDDEADARELLTLILQRAGARVIPASSVREAIDRIKKKKPDLLVSDIEMPGEDGYSLIRRVRAQEAERGEGGLSAVALTAYAGRADRRRALMAGFQKHVPKPVDPAALVAAVAGLIGLPRKVHRVPDRSSDEATSR
jgi:PAS domain S-box-containing protein